jgi:hypothetical protein
MEAPNECDEELAPAYGLLFRSWINLTLLILCVSLMQYLLVKLSG